MNKKEIQEIYDLFIRCLPANCVHPDDIKIYGDTNKLRKEHARDWVQGLMRSPEKKCVCEKYKEKYPRLCRLREIHNWKNKRSRANRRGTRACVGIDNKIIYIYSRVFYEDGEVLATLLHEVGHFNTTGRSYSGYNSLLDKMKMGSFLTALPSDCSVDYINGFLAPELAAEEWMWNRWPYVYGKYKKLTGEIIE